MSAASPTIPRRPGWCATPHGYFLEWRRYFPGIEHALIGIILDRTEGDGKEWTEIGKDKFMLWTGGSKSTVKRGLSSLRAKNAIQVQRGDGGRGITPLYRVDRDAIERYILEQKRAHRGPGKGLTSETVFAAKRGSSVPPLIKDPILNQTPLPPTPFSAGNPEEEDLKCRNAASQASEVASRPENSAPAFKAFAQQCAYAGAGSQLAAGLEEFLAAYPPGRIDRARAGTAYEAKIARVPGAQELLMRSLAAHQACERWQKQPHFIPFASTFISRGDYNGPTPPYFELAGRETAQRAEIEYPKYETMAARKARKGLV